MDTISKTHKYIIYCAFVISGISGLIYESVWSQYLGLFLGHAAYAQTLTLAIFMGGMSIGAWYVSRNIHNIKNALFTYVLIEFALGLLGLFFHTIFEATINFSFGTLFPFVNNPILNNILKWLIASALILPQSILLGSTFPLICSGLIRRTKTNTGKTIAVLYFTNSIGAAFGALISTFLLIPNMGMPGALLVAATLNIAIAIILYNTSKKPEHKQVETKKDTNQSSTNLLSINRKLILLVAALTGFSSFVYEITWIRMLNLVLGTTLHSFEIMLSAFILGLALGGYWIKNKIDNIKNLLKYLGIIQVIMGAMALLTMPLYIESFSWVSDILQSVLQKTSTGYVFYNILTGSLATIIMIPAAFCAGMTLPILTNILFIKGDNEKAIGKIYAFNTIGALLGVWFAIHIGMTFLGLKYMLIFAATLDALMGIWLINKSTKLQKIFSKNKTGIIALISYLVLVATIIIQVDFSPRILSSGTFRTEKDSLHKNVKVLHYQDGKSASISVVSNDMEGGSSYRVISTNGKPDAGVMINGLGYTADEPTMVLTGTLPLLIKPQAKHLANIGFGSGLSTHSLLASENLISLDTIEIENEIIIGSRFFYKRNFRAYDDPRSNIVIDDAKTFFANKNTQYDIIISEPSNPWVLGVGNLFSEEFYSNIKHYLKDDGILIQWLQLYEIRPQILSTAINALSSEFKYFDAYQANSGDMILVSSNNEIPSFQYNNFNELNADIQTQLTRIGITNMASIRSRKTGSNKSLSKYFKSYSNAINSDYFPILGLEAPKDRFMKASSVSMLRLDLFNVPIFNLIGTEFDLNEIVKNHSADKYHPFTLGIKKSIDFVNYYSNNQIDKMQLDMKTLGIISTFQDSKYFCGKSREVEIQWLKTYSSIYDKGVISGFESLNKIVKTSLPIIDDCQKLSTLKETTILVTALKLFAEQNFMDFILYINDNINQITYDNTNIKRSLINKALFSIIKLNPSKVSEEKFTEILKANNSTRADHTSRWLESYL